MLLEEIDNLFDSLRAIDWAETYAAVTEQIKMLPAFLDIFDGAVKKMAAAKDKAIKDIKDIGKSEWAYYIGYGLTFFIPATAVAKILGKAGKGGQMLGKLLVWIEKVLGDIFGYVLNKSAPLFEKLIGIVRAVAAKLRKGTTELAKIIRELFVKLREWLESFVGKVDIGIQNAKVVLDSLGREIYIYTIPGTSKILYAVVLPIEPLLNQIGRLLSSNVRNKLRSMGITTIEKNGTYIVKQGGKILFSGERAELRVILKAVGYKGILILEDSGKLLLLFEEKILFSSQPESFANLLKQIFEGTEKDVEKRLIEMSRRIDNIDFRKAKISEYIDAGQGKGKNFRPHEVDSLAEAEVIYNGELRAPDVGEAGDGIFISGSLRGKSVDAMGTPKYAFESHNWKNRTKNEIKRLFESIDKHFAKIHSPKADKPLDKILFDFKNYDDFNPELRKEVMNYIKNNYKKYIDNGQIDFIN